MPRRLFELLHELRKLRIERDRIILLFGRAFWR